MISAIALLGILLVMEYSIMLMGKPGREKALLQDLPQLQRIIPEGAYVGTCDDVMNNFVYHVYLQRFHKIELTHDLSAADFYISKEKCAPDDITTLEYMGFLEAFEGEAVTLHKRSTLQQ